MKKVVAKHSEQLQTWLLQEHSKEQCWRIVSWVGQDPQRFAALINLLLFSDQYRIIQRAAWPVTYCVQAHPALMTPHWNNLVQQMQVPGIHTSIKRNGLRLMQDIVIPEELHGWVMDSCFTFLETPTEAVATKAFALKVLHQLAQLYPEILPEINTLIKAQLPYQTPAFKSRAKQLFNITAN